MIGATEMGREIKKIDGKGVSDHRTDQIL